MIALDIWNNDYFYTIDDIVKNISVDENLTTNLESSSLIWKVTLPSDCQDSLAIIQKDDLHAKLYDGATVFFTGWVSTNFSYVIDTHGQQAVQITLEDNGTHLLKTPYVKDQSVDISGKFSSMTTGDLGVVQDICDTCGITCVSNIMTDNTEVKAIADAGETCESLLKSVCKEMGYVYLFNELGQLYLKPLSTDTLPTGNTIYDNSIYDSINLTRRARTYRGSRIKWNELGTKTGCLIYRVIEGQSTIYPNCHVEVHTGDTLPDPQGGITYIAASDIKDGSEIFSITNVQPSMESSPNGIITTDFFGRKGAKDLAILITANNDGYITKMEATADVVYIKNHNVTYGDAADPNESITENLHEEECKWIHTETPAKKYANFIAQYDRYCSSEFQFKTKGTYALGDIIHLNENLHTGLDAYLMVTRRSRTLTSYDSTNKTFGGVWTYIAVSTRAFDYNKTTSEESTSIPPSTSYTETQPDVSDISSLQLYTDKSFLVKNLRSTATQTMTIKASVAGGLVVSLTSASYSDGTSIPIYDDRTHSDIPRIQPVDTSPDTWTFEDGWELICYENKDAESVNITGVAGTLTNTIGISLNDVTQYYKFLGNYSSNPTESQANSVILVNDFYLNTTDGKTYECTSRTETQSVPTFTWSEMPLNADNANKFLIALESATQAGVQLENLSNPNTVSWFNTIIAAKAVIDSLFSKYITILNGGSIHSSAYSDTGTYTGPGSGFYLGSDGSLKCYSADMNSIQAVDANISGNSAFHGKFDCDIIKTEPENPSSYYDTTNGSVADIVQAKRIADQLILEGLIDDYSTSWSSSPFLPASIIGVTSDVAYVRVYGLYNSRDNYYTVSIYFYNSSMTELNIRNIVSCTTVGGNSVNYLYYNGNYNYGQYATNGINLRIYTGQNRLWVDVPFATSAGVLSSGMLFKGTTATSVSGVQGYPLYVKA